VFYVVSSVHIPQYVYRGQLLLSHCLYIHYIDNMSSAVEAMVNTSASMCYCETIHMLKQEA